MQLDLQNTQHDFEKKENELKREKEDRQKEEERLKLEIEKQIQLVADVKEDLRLRLLEKEERIEEQRKITRDYETQTERLISQIDELQKQLEDKKENVNELKQQLTKKEQDMNFLQSLNKEFKEKLAKEAREKSRLETVMTEKLKETKIQMGNYQSTIHQFEQHVEEMELRRDVAWCLNDILHQVELRLMFDTEEKLRMGIVDVMRKIREIMEERDAIHERLKDYMMKITALPAFYQQQIFCPEVPPDSLFDALQ